MPIPDLGQLPDIFLLLMSDFPPCIPVSTLAIPLAHGT